MSVENEHLTAGERRFLERQKEADKEGVTLQEYYRLHGLSLPALYSMRRQLIIKGVLLEPPKIPPTPNSSAPAPTGRFAAVKLVGQAPVSSGTRCRLTSPRGWIIEFDGLPDLRWIGGLMGVQS